MTPSTTETDAARTVARAARNHWYVVLVVTALVSALAVTGARLKAPEYRAASKILIGNVNVSAAIVPGYTLANQQLAATYARLATTSVVEDAVAADLLAQGYRGAADYTASPLAETPLIVVEATSKNQADAVLVVQAATKALTAYVTASTDPTKTAAAQLSAAQAASLQLAKDSQAEATLQAQYDAAPADGRASLGDALAQATATVASDQLSVTLANSRVTSAFNSTTDAVSVSAVAAAAPSGDDRTATLEKAVLAGVILGLVIGVAIAVRVEAGRTANRDRRDQRRATTPSIDDEPAAPVGARTTDHTGKGRTPDGLPVGGGLPQSPAVTF